MSTITINTLLYTKNIPHIDHLDYSLIIAHVLKKDRVFVLAYPETILTKSQEEEIKRLHTLRAQGYPLAYICNTKEFFGRSFAVTRDTLIPRPETEIMISDIINFCSSLSADQRILIIDIGTGSGAIIITLACELHCTHVHTFIATDISPRALTIAQKNMRSHNVAHMISLHQSDLLHDPQLQNTLMTSNPSQIIIAANLPYVDSAQSDILLSDPASRGLAFEPDGALWSDDHGLAHYKTLIAQTIQLKQSFHKTPCTSFYEIDPAQEKSLSDHIFACTKNTSHITRDLTNRPRILSWSL